MWHDDLPGINQNPIISHVFCEIHCRYLCNEFLVRALKHGFRRKFTWTIALTRVIVAIAVAIVIIVHVCYQCC